jgi:hypothetical protein
MDVMAVQKHPDGARPATPAVRRSRVRPVGAAIRQGHVQTGTGFIEVEALVEGDSIDDVAIMLGLGLMLRAVLLGIVGGLFSRDPETPEGVKHRADADGDAIGVGIAFAEFFQREVRLLAEQGLQVQLALGGDGARTADMAGLRGQLAGFDEELLKHVNGVRADPEQRGRLAPAVRQGVAEHPHSQIE